MNPHFPAEPWTPSLAFLQFLDSLPRTAAYERQLRANKARMDAELAELRANAASEREVRRIRAEALLSDPLRPAPKRGWSNARKVKHVVKGRLHLIEDDDEKGRTGYVERNRFTFEGEEQ